MAKLASGGAAGKSTVVSVQSAAAVLKGQKRKADSTADESGKKDKKTRRGGMKAKR